MGKQCDIMELPGEQAARGNGFNPYRCRTHGQRFNASRDVEDIDRCPAAGRMKRIEAGAGGAE